jgi:AraC-like DNA-binding protein
VRRHLVLEITAIVPGIVFIALLLLLPLDDELDLFPGVDFTGFPYTDKDSRIEPGGSGVDDFRILPDRLIFSYTLKEGISHPYAGINIGRKGGCFDIQGYDTLKIAIHSSKSGRLGIFILLYIDGISNNSNNLTYLYLQKEIPVGENKDQYVLELRDFHIPQWWYQANNLMPDDARLSRDFSKTAAILIQGGTMLPVGTTDTIELTKVAFTKNRMSMFLFFGSFTACFYLGVLVYFLWQAYKQRIIRRMRLVPIPYEYIEVENEREPDIRKIIEYLGEHYREPDLSVKTVGAACSVPAYKIPILLKREFHVTFPGYVNSLRLNEAKRLLKETEMSISDIVMEIGYNNISHFNNLFKFYAESTPRQYREKSRE